MLIQDNEETLQIQIKINCIDAGFIAESTTYNLFLLYTLVSRKKKIRFLKFS